MTPVRFDTDGKRPIELHDPQLVVAGYTGADGEAVQRHIDELAAIGVPPPASVPSFFPLDSSLLTQAEVIEVAGPRTSGEVEPVLLRVSGDYYLTLGSDHTDREIETRDILASKAACPKPVSRRATNLERSGRWDRIEVASSVDGAAYQADTLALLRPTSRVLDEYLAQQAIEGDVVMFGGTVPLLTGDFVAGERWHLEMRLPGETIGLSYRTMTRS